MGVKKSLVIFFIVAVQLTIAICGGVLIAYAFDSDEVLPNIYIEDISIEGLTREEAIEKVATETKGALDNEVLTLEAKDQKYMIPFERIYAQYDIEAAIDKAINQFKKSNVMTTAFSHFKRRVAASEEIYIPLKIVYDEQKLRQELDIINAQIKEPYENAVLHIDGDEVEVIPDTIGKAVDIENTLYPIREMITDTRVFDLVIKDVQAEVIAEDFEGLEQLMVTFSLDAHEDKQQAEDKKGIDFAVSALNQRLVRADGQISLLELFKREIEKGETSIKEINNAGINQVVTTLYNALLMADMSILQRTSEQYLVDYIEAGREAVVEEPYIDFVFYNQHDFPILLFMTYEEDMIGAKVFGKTVDDDIHIEVQVRDHQVVPKRVVAKPDDSLATGEKVLGEEGEDGLSVSTYKVYFKDGKEIKAKEVSTDAYQPKDEIVYIGAKSEERDSEGLK